MATMPRDGDLPQTTPNLGIFRPPLIFGAAIAVGLAFQWMWPRPVRSPAGLGPMGGGLIVVALVLLFAAVRRFQAAGTPVPARKPTTAIVRTGPYRFSRNPIYLAFSLLQLGVALWLNSWWLVATLAAAVAIIHYIVIPREEQYLEARFGAEYRDYKAAVRRWM